METAITLGYYISTLGFILATIFTGLAIRKYGTSALASVLTYFFIGTGIFLVITVFQKLGADFWGISDESMDIWWHLMFFLSMLSYYFGLRTLVGLGSADSSVGQKPSIATEKIWGFFCAAALIVIFVIPPMAEPFVLAYAGSNLAALGLHHFLAFLSAAVVGSYLLSAKKNLGQIGRAIAGPMIIALSALSFQHFWELLFESWKTVQVTTEVGEGGERIFLIVASACITYTAWRLKSFAER